MTSDRIIGFTRMFHGCSTVSIRGKCHPYMHGWENWEYSTDHVQQISIVNTTHERVSVVVSHYTKLSKTGYAVTQPQKARMWRFILFQHEESRQAGTSMHGARGVTARTKEKLLSGLWYLLIFLFQGPAIWCKMMKGSRYGITPPPWCTYVLMLLEISRGS